MASNYWIKLYHEMLDDPKTGRLSDSQFRLMINLFLLAGDCEQNGYLPPIEDIRWRLRNPETFDTNLQALINNGILTMDGDSLLVVKFAERQSAMSDTERSQRRREKVRKQEYYGSNCATEVQRLCTDSVTDVDIDIDKDVDKKRKDIRDDIVLEDLYKKTSEELAEESLNQPFAVLSRAFIEYSGLPELSGGPQRYTESISKMVKMGVTPEILGEAITDLRDKNYNIVSPGSCINACVIAMSRKNGKRAGPKEDHRKYLSGEYGDIGLHNEQNQEMEA